MAGGRITSHLRHLNGDNVAHGAEFMSRLSPQPGGGEIDGPKGFDDFELRLGDMMRGERATMGKSLLDVQRDLKIKATYIAAIENADPTAFDTPGFIAGYVRSYARYLGMDPEWAFQKFCEESHFEKAHGMSAAASGSASAMSGGGASRSTAASSALSRDPFTEPRAPYIPSGESFFAGFEPAALGAVLVLLLLIGGVGYGGWTVLKEIQKVKFTPVEQAPGVTIALDPLAPNGDVLAASTGEEADGPMLAEAPEDAFDRLYRPRALEVPVLVARDGPIATLDPERGGVLAQLSRPDAPPGLPEGAGQAGGGALLATGNDREQRGMAGAGSSLASADGGPSEPGVKVIDDPSAPVAIIATRPAWVQVKAADGSVILEKILDAGERYVIPASEKPPVLRTGYAGAVYFAVNGQTYGPAGKGPNVVKNIVLGPEELKEAFSVAELKEHPELAKVVAELARE